MLLNNVTMVNQCTPVNIAVSNEKIISVANDNAADYPGEVIQLSGAIAFPGLINSHDHLDFNCFAPLGQKIYNNYTEWGRHIHRDYKKEINAVLQIPKALRIAWGIYKNLLAGVTTVVNHGDELEIQPALITVHQQSQNLHSVQFQKDWKLKLNNPFLKKKVCVIHTGEGVDDQSAAEIDELLQWNLLKRKLIGVHAVAMNGRQAKGFSGIVWCPQSNRVLLDRHADILQFKEKTRVVFGTDSTLTGNWNIWQHLRLARSLNMTKDAELFEMVTGSAARLWQTNSGELQAGKDADIIIAKTNNGSSAWNDLFSINPSSLQLVMQKGKIRLFDDDLMPQLAKGILQPANFSRITIDGTAKWVEGNLPALMHGIRSHYPPFALPPELSVTNTR